MNRANRDSAVPSQTLVVPELIQGDWTSLVILTYTAQLGFFEAHLLRQLTDVPLRLVLADDRRLADTFRDAARTGQRLSRANRTYLAAGIRNPAAAHAKAVLLTAPTRGRLLVGSGNLGQDGYATAGELWHVYEYSDQDQRHLDQFTVLRSLLDGICARGWIDPPAVELLRQSWSAAPWLPEHVEKQPSLHHNLTRPLIDAFTDAVDWPVRTLTAHAPFFDPDAAGLSALIDRLQPRRLRLLLTRSTSVDVDALRAAVSRAGLTVVLEEVGMTADPRTFLHAKFVHAIGDEQEAMLGGSANLSQSALLRSAAERGNIELGIIETRPRSGFDEIYAPLTISPIADLADLGLRYHPTPEAAPSPDPVLLWSQIQGRHLTLVFDRAVAGYEISLSDQDGTVLEPLEVSATNETVYLRLNASDLDRLARGGRVDVELIRDGEPITQQPTWPYQIESLGSRRQRAAENTRLTDIGSLPTGDAELYDLLRQLEQTLIIDPVGVWVMTRPEQPVPPEGDDGPAIRWEDLDWDRVRRHPRYAAYHNSSGRLPPTDIQAILSSIVAHLGDLGADNETAQTGRDEDTDDELRDEPAGSSPDEDDEDAPSRPPRHLKVSTRTRMASTRFVTRYARAVRDQAFQEALGPTVAVHNAAIFNHLLRLFLQRDMVNPDRAIDAQLAVWTLLWGSPGQPGLLQALHGEERDAADAVLARLRVRPTVLGAMSDLAEYDLVDLTEPVRQQVQHLLVDPVFDFGPEIVAACARNRAQARALTANLRWLAAPRSEDEAAAAVILPWNLPRTAARWDQEKVRRARAERSAAWEERVDVLRVTSPVSGLTAQAARACLARLVAFSEIAGWKLDYFRIRFATGSDVCLWDATTRHGLCLIGREESEFQHLKPEWPAWYQRLLAAQSQSRADSAA